MGTVVAAARAAKETDEPFVKAERGRAPGNGFGFGGGGACIARIARTAAAELRDVLRVEEHVVHTAAGRVEEQDRARRLFLQEPPHVELAQHLRRAPALGRQAHLVGREHHHVAGAHVVDPALGLRGREPAVAFDVPDVEHAPGGSDVFVGPEARAGGGEELAGRQKFVAPNLRRGDENVCFIL